MTVKLHVQLKLDSSNVIRVVSVLVTLAHFVHVYLLH
jgi:hypothetical protein